MPKISHVNNLCACLHFCKRKILLIMLLQVHIKDSIMFSAQTPSAPRFEEKDLGLSKLEMKN